MDGEAHRRARFTPLGLHRNRVIGCLGGNSPRAPTYFATPPDDVRIFDAFRSYIEQELRESAGDTSPITISLLAAGRLLLGEIAAADVILDHLPAQPIKLDHGAGICLVVPVYALKNALPLPETLHDTSRWLQGSLEQGALRAWLAAHRDRLRWVETKGVYHLTGDTDD